MAPDHGNGTILDRPSAMRCDVREINLVVAATALPSGSCERPRDAALRRRVAKNFVDPVNQHAAPDHLRVRMRLKHGDKFL